MSGPGDSRALLQSARKARPSAESRQRMRAGIGRKVALAAAAGASVASATTGAAAAGAGSAALSKSGLFGFLGKVGLAIAFVGVTGVGVHAWLGGTTVASVASPPATMAPPPIGGGETPPAERAAGPESPASAPSARVEERLVEETANETPSPSTSTAPSAPSSRASAARRDAASIAAEVALLRKAQSALRDGDGDASLKALDALASKHPSGAMREERDAARVVALCSAGRVDEARREGLRFLAQWPSSLQSPRVRASCAFAAPSEPKR